MTIVPNTDFGRFKTLSEETVMTLSNELTAIKILDPSAVDDDGGHGNRYPTRDQIRKAFDAYLLESRSVPVEFFKEECRAMLDEEFRERWKSLHDKLKKSTGLASRKSSMKKMSRYSQASRRLASISSPAPPSTVPAAPTVQAAPTAEDYRTRTLDRISYKIDYITWFVTENIVENEIYPLENSGHMGCFIVDYRKLVKDLNLQKTKLAAFQRSVVNIVDQLVQIHQSVSKTCENIAQETSKRYKSEDIYSDDRSVIIIVDDKEKHYVSQLNSQIDNFFERKTELVQTLEKITALLRNYIVRKYELDAEFMEYVSTFVPLQYKDKKEHELSTLEKDTTTVNKTERQRNIQLCKIFKKFP